MAHEQRTSKAMKSVLGAALLATGFVLFFGNLDALEACVNRFVGAPASAGMEALPTLVLAISHLLQVYVFDHQGFLSVLQQILVSFSPLILVLGGAALLQSSFGNQRQQYPAGTAVSDLESRS